VIVYGSSLTTFYVARSEYCVVCVKYSKTQYALRRTEWINKRLDGDINEKKVN